MDPIIVLASILAIIIAILYSIYFLRGKQLPQKEEQVEKEEEKKEATKDQKIKTETKVKIERELEHKNIVATLRGGKDVPKVGNVIGLAASPRYIAQIRDNDQLIRLWKYDTLLQAEKKQTTVPVGKQGEYPTAVAMSHVGDLLAVASEYTNSVKLFYITPNPEKSNKLIEEVTNTQFDKQKNSITQLEFSQNGRFLISLCGGEDILYVYSVSNIDSKMVQKISLGLLQVFRFALSDKYLTAASFTSILKTYSVSGVSSSTVHESQKKKEKDTQPVAIASNFSYKKHLELKGHTKSIYWVSFSPTEEKLTSVGSDGTLKIFSCKLKPETEMNVKDSDYLLIDKKVERIVPNSNIQQFHRVMYCNANVLVALADDDRTLVFMDGRNAKVIQVIDHTTLNHAKLSSWTVSSDGMYLFTGGEDNLVQMWRIPTPE
jgi:WD40 repeat protein